MNKLNGKAAACMAVASVAVCALALAFTGGGGARAEAPAANTITVTAQGAVSVKPDVAYVEIGLQTSAATAAAAQADNAKQFADLMAALKTVGITDADVKTSNYYVYPRYNYIADEKGEKREVTAYECGDTVTVTVNNVNDAAKVADAAGQGGATNIGGVRFSVKDTSEAYDKALANAYASALKRAGTLAKAAGVTLGKPVSITENGSYAAPMYYGNVKEMAADSAAGNVPTKLYTSDLDVSATVTVTFGY